MGFKFIYMIVNGYLESVLRKILSLHNRVLWLIFNIFPGSGNERNSTHAIVCGALRNAK